MNSVQIHIRSAVLRFSALMLLTFGLQVGQAQAQVLQSLFGNSQSPLPVEEAFKIELGDVTATELELDLKIAKGYYLYQKKFAFNADNTSVSIGAPAYPEALVHEDDYFGESNIYRKKATIRLPLSVTKQIDAFTLNVDFQGCADIGLCYPPTTNTYSVELPQAQLKKVLQDAQAVLADASVNANANPITATKPNAVDLSGLLKNKPLIGNNGNSQDLLPPSEAFTPSVTSANNGQIIVEWMIQPGYYLYRDKISAALIDAGSAAVSSIDVDRGEFQNDAYFGDVEVLREVPSARISISGAEQLQSAQLEVFYQGCADIGVCFPPESKILPVAFTDVVSNIALSNTNANSTALSNTNTSSANAIATSSVSAAAVSTASKPPISEQDKLGTLLAGGSLNLIALAFYGAGLLLAFTACVYPMIPILSSLIVGQGKALSTKKAFSLSLVYVLSMASVFAVLGILIGLSGYNIQPLFQNPWVLTAFAGLFVVLALSMFGLFQLQVPNAIQTKITALSNKQSGGTYTGVAIMGLLSALIVGPCVTPPLVAALAYIANTGDAVLGGIALFAMGLGMGTPLLFIGTSLGKFMPKAGGWMETTQRIFGVILIAVAIYLLSRFLPGNIIMMMFAALAIFAGIYFGATDNLNKDSRTSQRLGKSASLIALIYGIVLMVGALAGGTSMLSPLRGIFGQAQLNGQAIPSSEHISFDRIKTVDDLQNVLAQAKTNNRAVMLDFYADWCISCKEMEAFTFTDASVIEKLRDVTLIQVDVTKNDADDKAMLNKFGLFGPPAIIFYDQQGTELTAARVVGFMSADKFSAHIDAHLN